MSYICKGCPENNNGWCKKRKMQGLKNITECEFFENTDMEKDTGKDCEASLIIEEEFSNEAHKNMGKREIFYNIQKQMIAIDKLGEGIDKFEKLKETMISLGHILTTNESFGGIALEFIIDRDILESSKAIIKEWNSKEN